MSEGVTVTDGDHDMHRDDMPPMLEILKEQIGSSRLYGALAKKQLKGCAVG